MQSGHATCAADSSAVEVTRSSSGSASPSLLAGMLAVRHGSVSGFEQSTFRAVNDLPGALYPVLWPFQQLGVIVVGPIAAISRSCRWKRALGNLWKLPTDRSACG